MFFLNLVARILPHKQNPVFGTDKAQATFQQAVEETFALGRKNIQAMEDLSIVNTDSLKTLLNHYKLPLPYDDEIGNWPQGLALDGLASIMNYKPQLVTETAVTTALDNLLACPGKQQYLKAAQAPEDDPRLYVSNLWCFINTAADVNPNIFRSETIRNKLIRAYTNENALRQATASLCLTNLYFKEGLLEPRDYFDTMIQGVTHDALLPQGDALGGKALFHINDYLAQPVTTISPLACTKRHDLVNALNGEDLDKLRALHEATESRSPALHEDLAKSILSLLRSRPGLAKETDLDLIDLETAAEQGFASAKALYLGLATASALAMKHPEWDWENLNRAGLKIQKRLQKPASAGTKTTEKDGIVLIEWRPNDLPRLRATQNFCDAFVEYSRQPEKPATPTQSLSSHETGLGTKS